MNSAQAKKLLIEHASDVNGAIGLYPTRADVDRINTERLNKLRSDPHTYACLDASKWVRARKGPKTVQESATNQKITDLVSISYRTIHLCMTNDPQDSHRYEALLQLKHGMKVVLLQNLDLKAGLVNGTQGRIMTFKKYKEAEMPTASNGKNNSVDERGAGDAPVLIGAHARYRQKEILRYIEKAKHKKWPVVQFNHGVTRTIYADCAICSCGDDDEPYCVLSRTQLPLMAGYAVTIHKSQVRQRFPCA